MKRRIIASLIVATALLASASLAANYGKITGSVIQTETGEPIVGANVRLEGTALGAATDSDGRYTILQVPPGTYSILASSIGYQTVRLEGVQVQANRIAYADFSLPSTVIGMDEVVVVGERPVIEKDVTATLRSVSAEEIEVMPTTTVTDVLQTQPGVVSSGGLHFRGGRSGEVTYYVDGVPLIDPLFSEISSSEVINRDAIQEMQVIRGTYSAEYGNAMSGIINITTKEGAASIGADLNIKSSGLGLEEASLDNNRTVFRGNLTGPFLSPKTTFFLSGFVDDRDNYLPWGFRKDRNIFAKLTDHHLENMKWTLGLQLSSGKRKSYSHPWKYIRDQYWYEPNTDSRMVQLGLTHSLQANLYYSLLAYYTAYHYDSGDYDYRDLSPAYQRDQNKEFYTLSYVSSYEEDDQQTLGLKGDLLWQANRFNEVKAGFEVRQHIVQQFYISSPYYDDHVLNDYEEKPREAAAYLQDKVNFSNIILSAGLRFDLTDPNADYWANPYDAFNKRPEGFHSSDIHTQLSPRLGISYPVTDRTVFHFGYGHYFQRPEYQFIYKGLSRDGSAGVYDVDGDGDVDYDDNIIMNLRSGNGRFGNPNLKPEKTIQYEFGLSHQIRDDYLLNASIYSKKITNLIGTRTFFALVDNPEYWETFTLHINEDFAYNNGLELQVRKMRGRYLSGEINYTYAVAEGSSSGPLERVGLEEANRQTLKFFPLHFDQRHSINALLNLRFGRHDGPTLGGLHLLESTRFSLLFRYGSGLPYTKGTRGATEPYEINNARLPENWTIDLKIHRDIQVGRAYLSPYMEVYNLTDKKNVVSVDPYTGKPDESYGRTYEYAADPENWGPPRLIYFGITVSY